LLHHFEDFLSDVFVRTFHPVVSMNYIVRLVFEQVGNITPVVLRDDLGNSLYVLYQVLVLLICQIRQALMGGDGLVCV